MNLLSRNVKISEIAISQGLPSVSIKEPYHMLCSDSDFYRLTCFHSVLNPHTSGTAGSVETLFFLKLREKTNGEGRTFGRNRQSSLNS